jgi:hypothetical protein
MENGQAEGQGDRQRERRKDGSSLYTGPFYYFVKEA